MPSETSSFVGIFVEILCETDTHVSVTFSDPNAAVWLPKSEIDIEPPSKIDGQNLVILPTRLAVEKGLSGG